MKGEEGMAEIAGVCVHQLPVSSHIRKCVFVCTPIAFNSRIRVMCQLRLKRRAEGPKVELFCFYL